MRRSDLSVAGNAASLQACEELLGSPLPGELRRLLSETNGVEGEYGLGLVWSAQRIGEDNARFFGRAPGPGAAPMLGHRTRTFGHRHDAGMTGRSAVPGAPCPAGVRRTLTTGSVGRRLLDDDVQVAALLIAGTSSWAGKSLLATAVCASLRRRGVRVAPFKAVNMANNARVVEGGEIGTAQYFQALAAGVAPAVDHNPILVKPETGSSSQVVCLGRVDRELSAMAWRARAERMWPSVREAFDRVVKAADVVVIEGAGSPAEINLAGIDLANLRIGRHANAPMLLVCDIDRGGAFAHLYGTWALLEADDRDRVRGFVLNRFRGDAALLDPGPVELERRTGVATLGVVPMIDHGLPDEDGADPAPSGRPGRRIRAVRAPGASNLDEWWPLRETSEFRWATRAPDLADAELIVLPGSKTVADDLSWMRAKGIDRGVRAAHHRGVPILAVCGGAQMLGETIEDPHGVEGGAHVCGIGLLPVATVLGPHKTVRRTRQQFRSDLPTPWRGLSRLAVNGYEIRFGDTRPTGPIQPAFTDGSGFIHGSVLAVYAHGLAEDPDVVTALSGHRPQRPLSAVLAGLANLADTHLDMKRILAML
jgi:adenosylcobyric acid synthase